MVYSKTNKMQQYWNAWKNLKCLQNEKNDKYDFNKVFKYMYMLTKSWLHDSGTVETFVKECC